MLFIIAIAAIAVVSFSVGHAVGKKSLQSVLDDTQAELLVLKAKFAKNPLA